jgi:Domain of unknown function (DUF5134)
VPMGHATSWALSVLFGLTGLWYAGVAAHLLADRRLDETRDLMSAALHALMSAAMIAMLWSWGTSIPTIAQVMVFTAAAAWYVSRLTLSPVPAVVTTPDADAPDRCRPNGSHRHHDTRLGNAYHAAMMASMVWMALAMSTMTMPTAAAATPSGMAGMGSMAGMAGMGSMAGMGGMGGAPSMSMGNTPAWVAGSCLALGAAFFAASACYLVAIIVGVGAHRQRLNRHLVANVIGSLMAAGMAVAFLEMV